MPDKSWRPRLTVELTEEQYNRLQALIPWGIQRPFFSLIVDDVIEVLEKKGEVALALVLDRYIKPREVVRLLHDIEKKGGKDGDST